MPAHNAASPATNVFATHRECFGFEAKPTALVYSSILRWSNQSSIWSEGVWLVDAFWAADPISLPKIFAFLMNYSN